MDITPPRDTLGTESLQRSNEQREVRKTGDSRPPGSVTSSERWHPPQTWPPASQRDQATLASAKASGEIGERRSGKERRSGQERRTAAETRDVPFDTRGDRERRQAPRRAEDRERAGQPAAKHGIDLKA